jgi:hypothetical protein
VPDLVAWGSEFMELISEDRCYHHADAHTRGCVLMRQGRTVREARQPAGRVPANGNDAQIPQTPSDSLYSTIA